MQFELKSLSLEAVPRALEKAVRYRLLNEPSEAASISVIESSPPVRFGTSWKKSGSKSLPPGAIRSRQFGTLVAPRAAANTCIDWLRPSPIT